MPGHHIEYEMLVDYAAGSLPEALSLVVATHLACCSECRRKVQEMEDIGGALLESQAETALHGDALAQVLDRLDAPEPAPEPARLDAVSRSTLPGPLARFVNRNLGDLRWRRAGPQIEEAVLATASPRYKTMLLRVPAGAAMPSHTHDGREYTLVLTGGIIDNGVEYRRGDVMTADPDLDHRPAAAPGEDCICLAVLDAPVRLTGLFGRLLNPFLRH